MIFYPRFYFRPDTKKWIQLKPYPFLYLHILVRRYALCFLAQLRLRFGVFGFGIA